jgi:hypothetical protein
MIIRACLPHAKCRQHVSQLSACMCSQACSSMHDARTTTWTVLKTSPQRCRVSPGAAAATRTSAGGPSSASTPALAPATACKLDPLWALRSNAAAPRCPPLSQPLPADRVHPGVLRVLRHVWLGLDPRVELNSSGSGSPMRSQGQIACSGPWLYRLPQMRTLILLLDRYM